MSAPEGNSESCFPVSLNVSRDEVEGNIEGRARKTNPAISEGADIKCFVTQLKGFFKKNIHTIS